MNLANKNVPCSLSRASANGRGGSGLTCVVPRVSIIVLLYNDERHVAECLDSILAQRCDFPFEIVVGDDASTDRSREIVADYARRFPEIVVPVLHERNLGVVENFLETGRCARGGCVAFCDSDDYWTDCEKLRDQVALLERDSAAAAVYADMDVLDEESGELCRNVVRDAPEGDVFEALLERNFIGVLTGCVRGDVFRAVLEELSAADRSGWSVQDYPFWLAAARRGMFRYLDRSVAVHRDRAESVSQSRSRLRKLAYKYGTWKIREWFLNAYGAPPELERRLREKGASVEVLYLFRAGEYGRLRAFSKRHRGELKGRRARTVAALSFSEGLLKLLNRATDWA